MDLEVVGRHALLFDDDAMAAFVNSSDALVEWNSLPIDRYDVRHLLSSPLPPRRRRNPQSSSHLSDSSLESEIDRERYLDLPEHSDKPEEEEAEAEAEKPGDSGGFHAVAFSYGSTDDLADQKNAYEGLECSGFRPPFPVPESLLQSLPPTEKVHQIIARTATFVSQHGYQSEIVLRVKQGNNPSFGFLMPDHHLHAYFRFLVDHQELLQSDADGKTQFDDKIAKTDNKLGIGGALSLLGSVYGSGEDEESVVEDAQESKTVALEKTVNATSRRDSREKTECRSNAAEKDKDEVISKHPPALKKDKAPVLKKNPSITASKTGSASSMKKKDNSGSISALTDKSKELLIVEPPSDLKKLIDKIVEFIMKNGKQFEATLCEEDSKHGRFPFLLPSNQYHPYYLKALQRAQESKASAKNSYGKDDSAAGRGLDKRGLFRESDDISSVSVGSDVPYESDRKEKFKMLIGKSKKDVEESPSKATEQEHGITVDAAAAILQAATRGIKNPNLGILSSKSINGHRHGQPDNDIQNTDQGGGHNSSDRGAKVIENAVSSETASEADSEKRLTKEQKLKAERLKRAKMFVTMLKSGTMPSGSEPLRSLSVEPSESGVLGAGAEVNLADKEREGSSAPEDVSMLDKSENSKRKCFVDEQNDRRSRRKYRSRSERHDEDDHEENDEEEREQSHSRKKHHSHGSPQERRDERERDDEERDRKHLKRKHRSHHSSHDDDHDDNDKKGKSHKHSRKKQQSHHHTHEDDDSDRHAQKSYPKDLSKKCSHHSHQDDDSEKDARTSSHHSHEDHNSEKDARTSYHKHSSKNRSSHHSSHGDEDEGDYDNEKYRKHSRKKHRSHRSSHQSRDRHRHGKGESSKDEESHQRSRYENEDGKEHHSEKEELEEGEISSKVLGQCTGGHVSRGSSTEIVSTVSRASSQPSETTEVPDDLRAKIRAMLMATR